MKESQDLKQQLEENIKIELKVKEEMEMLKHKKDLKNNIQSLISLDVRLTVNILDYKRCCSIFSS